MRIITEMEFANYDFARVVFGIDVRIVRPVVVAISVPAGLSLYARERGKDKPNERDRNKLIIK